MAAVGDYFSFEDYRISLRHAAARTLIIIITKTENLGVLINVRILFIFHFYSGLL